MEFWKPGRDRIFGKRAREYIGIAREKFGKVYLIDIGAGTGYHLLGHERPDGSFVFGYGRGADKIVAVEPSEAGTTYWKNWKLLSETRKQYKKERARLEEPDNIRKVRKAGGEDLHRYVDHGWANVVTNKDSPQNELILVQVRRALRDEGFYLKSGKGVVKEVAEFLLKMSRPPTEWEHNLSRMEARINGVQSYVAEIEDAGFEVLEVEPMDDYKFVRGREDLEIVFSYPSHLGKDFNARRHGHIVDEALEELEASAEVVQDPDTHRPTYRLNTAAGLVVARKV